MRACAAARCGRLAADSGHDTSNIVLVASHGPFASLFYSGAARQRGKRVVDFKMGYPFITAMDQTEGEPALLFIFPPRWAAPP